MIIAIILHILYLSYNKDPWTDLKSTYKTKNIIFLRNEVNEM